MEKKEKTSAVIFHTYMWKQMLLSNGLSNGLINGLLYWAITRSAATPLSYLYGTLLTNAILGVIVIILYPILIKSSLKKHPELHFPYKRDDHLLASLYPHNVVLVRIINFLVCFVITTLLTMGVLYCCFQAEVGVALGSILRGVDCALFSILAYYLCLVFSSNSEDKDSTKENTLSIDKIKSSPKIK